MQYLLDTVTVIRHFSGSAKIGKLAYDILNNAIERGYSFYISAVSFMEIMYLSEKNRIPINLSDAIQEVRKASNYFFVNLSVEIILEAERIKFDELHDRLILATALWLDIPVISSDIRFKEVDKIELIWD